MKVFYALLFASISIALSSADETYLWNAETRIYYPQMSDGALKVLAESGKFEERKAVNSGNQNALFPRILVFTDYPNFIKKTWEHLANLAQDVIASMNEKFATLKTDRPVEALLAGLVILKTPDIYNGTASDNIGLHDLHLNHVLTAKYRVESKVTRDRPLTTVKVPVWPREFNFRRAGAELAMFSKWMTENADHFENLNAHIYLYLSSHWLVDNANREIRFCHLVMGLTDLSKEICDSKPVVIMPDLIGNTHPLYAMAISYAMGLKDSRDQPDFPYFTNSSRIPDSKLKDWQDKAVEAFNNKDRDNKYSCFKDSDYDE